jgi:hypothetical protein
MPPHVDAVHGHPREGERGALDGIRRAEVGEDRAMVIDVGVDVEEPHARRLDRVAKRADDAGVAPFADIRDALEERVGRPRPLWR